MAKGKNVFTTGDVARICNVAPRTVSKWFDSGYLKGYRIPGSKDRRIPISELISFMKENDMPMTSVLLGKMRVLIVDNDEKGVLSLADVLRVKGVYDVQTVSGGFEAGLVAQKFAPHVLLINIFAKNIDAAGICQSIRGNSDLQAIKVIALANQLSSSEVSALLQKGFDDVATNPADAMEVVRKIEETIAITY